MAILLELAVTTEDMKLLSSILRTSFNNNNRIRPSIGLDHIADKKRKPLDRIYRGTDSDTTCRTRWFERDMLDVIRCLGLDFDALLEERTKI